MSRWTILAALSLTRFSFGYQFQSVASVAPMLSRELGTEVIDEHLEAVLASQRWWFERSDPGATGWPERPRMIAVLMWMRGWS